MHEIDLEAFCANGSVEVDGLSQATCDGDAGATVPPPVAAGGEGGASSSPPRASPSEMLRSNDAGRLVG
jgi:hypothetical protein